MKLLLDTHILLWSADQPHLLSHDTATMLEDGANDLLFSVANLWEIAIKYALGRADFYVEPRSLRFHLLANGYQEVQINAEHVLAAAALPRLHRDPFDRLLLAQALVEDATLLTADKIFGRYSGPIRFN